MLIVDTGASYLTLPIAWKERLGGRESHYLVWARENLSRAADEGRTWPKGYFALHGSIDDPSFEHSAGAALGLR